MDNAKKPKQLNHKNPIVLGIFLFLILFTFEMIESNSQPSFNI